jgi:DNA-binding IclR family transcriptional regulator
VTETRKVPWRGIQSVVIGVRVLSAVAAQRAPATLSTIAQAAELSSSQTHRYLSSLIASGMVKQTPLAGLYDLDAGAIRVGLAALARLNIFFSVDEKFLQLARQTNRTCFVAIWGEAGPTIIRWFAGFPPVITSVAIGSILPLLQTATGQIFYIFGDRQVIDGQAEALMLLPIRTR